jgi:hypothetical protein
MSSLFFPDSVGPLTHIQLKVYQRFLDSEEVQLLIRKDEICDCEAGRVHRKRRCRCCYATDENGMPWTNFMFKYINILLKVTPTLGV